MLPLISSKGLNEQTLKGKALYVAICRLMLFHIDKHLITWTNLGVFHYVFFIQVYINNNPYFLLYFRKSWPRKYLFPNDAVPRAVQTKFELQQTLNKREMRMFMDALYLDITKFQGGL